MRRLILLPVLLISTALVLAACGGGSSSSPSSTSASSATVGSAVPVPAKSNGPAVTGPQSAHVLWKVPLGGPVVPGPVVSSGVVYAAANDGILRAIDLADGKVRWSFDGGGPYGKDLSTSPALEADGTVLWPGPEDTLFALSPAGKLEWKEKLPAQPTSPRVMADGSIVVGDMAGNVEDLVVKGGEPTVRWHLALGGTSYSSPALGKDGTVYTSTGETLYAIRDGKVDWMFAGASESEVSPAVAPDGTVVFGTNDSEYGISPEGEELWRHANGTRTFSSPVLTGGGLVYYGDNKGFVNVLQVADGKPVARIGEESRPGVWTAPAIDSRYDVYYGTVAGSVFGYDAAGKQLFELKTGGSVDSYPALAPNGTLLVGSTDGMLYAIGG
jgi:outer membrane protein assembly factor BamB